MRSVDDAVRALRELAHLNVLVREPGVLAAGAEDGPLDGLPVVVKDNVAVGGLPLTAGSPALEGYRPDADSGAVRRLRRAGATVVGQTNMHELARGTTSDNA
ncbi:amidase family protein, partial [Saccharomonospora iraqiensis]|uniref:amidase family protein n=1 Tax=Saccharomonospora iraqiensis TaxID=52698 RepID=UPI000592CFB5